MTTNDLRKLTDLFLDDELPLELQLEFKQAMFSDPELSAEVSEARKAKEALAEAYAEDHMAEDERQRVYSRLIVEMAAQGQRETQFDLPYSGQFQLPIPR